ncbi:hypothetical protein K438DRAFT_1796855 [Mycena galopus ATCC 62051]|nr:hypothetical protein K438DRAFT_1796855 [Mycena galopus ATCC 62051]
MRTVPASPDQAHCRRQRHPASSCSILRIRRLNWHATAALADVGTLKVHCVACAPRQIAKWRGVWTFGSIASCTSLDFFIYVCPKLTQFL